MTTAARKALTILSATVFLVLGYSSGAADSGTDAKGVFIGESAKAAEPKAAEAVEFNRKVVDYARVLGMTSSTDEQKQDVVAGLLTEREKSSHVLLGCLDAKKFTSLDVRLGALKGLKVTRPEGARVSPSLAWSAVLDPAEDVRAAAVDLIKQRKDDQAMGGMVRHLLGAFDEAGNVVNAPVCDAAVQGLKNLGEKRVYEALLYYVLCEMRPTMTELVSFSTRQIDAFTVTQGAAVTLIIPLSFPVQFPELAITRVRTTVSAPAAALRAATGQDFGADADRWKNWIRNR